MTNLAIKIKELGFTYTFTQAMSGSQYYIINGIKFRISDHDQPSHYQARNYFDVSSEESIIEIISNELFSFKANPVKRDGKFINAVYNSKVDGFDMVEISEDYYNILVLKINEKRNFFIENSYNGDLTF